jgi:hypothetical protein
LAQNSVKKTWSLVMDERLYQRLHTHLFPGDDDEHGAVLLAGLAESPRGIRLLAREVVVAYDGEDFIPGERGYRALSGRFVAGISGRCAEEGLVYLAVHNHRGTTHVHFSKPDLAAHARGYPALLDITNGGPVGALVFAQQAIAGDIWTADLRRHRLQYAQIVGLHPHKLFPEPPPPVPGTSSLYDRQARLFGDAGQHLLNQMKVGVIGAGGGGSLVLQMLARLGVGHLVAVDSDRVDITNLPRIVGARQRDIGQAKVEVAKRVAREANPKVQFEAIERSVVDTEVAHRLADTDFLFLATDTMQSRLIFNAIVHQYLIPGIQIGAKVMVEPKTGNVEDVFTVSRLVLPSSGCLQCNGLISSAQLQQEALSPEERRRQRYITDEGVPDPSVITLNALSASQATNDFLLIMTGLLQPIASAKYIQMHPCERVTERVNVRSEPTCRTCSGSSGSRYARGDRARLPCRL